MTGTTYPGQAVAQNGDSFQMPAPQALANHPAPFFVTAGGVVMTAKPRNIATFLSHFLTLCGHHVSLQQSQTCLLKSEMVTSC
jgi:hypothetical protein